MLNNNIDKSHSGKYINFDVNVVKSHFNQVHSAVAESHSLIGRKSIEWNTEKQPGSLNALGSSC